MKSNYINSRLNISTNSIIMYYKERQNLIKLGKQEFENGETIEDQADGLFMILEANWHEERRTFYKRYKKEFMNLAEYAKLWLNANKDIYFKKNPEVFKLLEEKFCN